MENDVKIFKKSFSDLFIQKTQPDWVQSQLNKLVQSEVHLIKFIQVLTDFIIQDAHPESTRLALIWIEYCLRNYSVFLKSPQIRKSLRILCSHVNHLSNLDSLYLQASNRGLVFENWSKSISKVNFLPHSLYYDDLIGIPSSNYIYTDGQEQPTVRSKSIKKTSHQSSFECLEDNADMDSDWSRSDSSVEDIVSESPGLDQRSTESDCGFFDINNEIISSEPEVSLFDEFVDQNDNESYEDDDENEHHFESIHNENCIVDDLSIGNQSDSESDNPEDDNFMNVEYDDEDDVSEESDENIKETFRKIDELVEKNGIGLSKKRENEMDLEISTGLNSERLTSKRKHTSPNPTPSKRQSERLKIKQDVTRSANKNKSPSKTKKANKRKSI